MATAAMGEERTVSIGRVLSRTFGVMGRNPLAAFGLAFLLSALPQLVINYLSQSVRSMALSTGATIAVGALSLVGGLISFALNTLVQGALVQATIADSEGRSATFGECLAAGMSRVLPLVAVGILYGLGVGFGMLLLLVPGCILLTMWIVASPAVVAERAGVTEAFGRSRALTAGARWKIFGLLLVVLVLLMILGGAWALLLVAFLGATPEGISLMGMLVGVVFNTAVASFFAILATSLFVELRNWKEGAPAETLGAIFS